MEPEVQTQRSVLRPLIWLVQTIVNSVSWVVETIVNAVSGGFGYRGVPWRNRITFRVDFQSQVLWTAMMVLCQPKITQVIASQVIHCGSENVQALLFSASAAGSTASFLW